MDFTDEQKARLIELQASLWWLRNDNDPEGHEVGAGSVADKLGELLDIIVGEAYVPPFMKKREG